MTFPFATPDHYSRRAVPVRIAALTVKQTFAIALFNKGRAPRGSLCTPAVACTFLGSQPLRIRVPATHVPPYGLKLARQHKCRQAVFHWRTGPKRFSIVLPPIGREQIHFLAINKCSKGPSVHSRPLRPAVSNPHLHGYSSVSQPTLCAPHSKSSWSSAFRQLR